MRDDLTKVLCEQPRPRSWDHYSNYRNLKKFEDSSSNDDNFEDGDRHIIAGGGATRESMKHRYGWDAKSFGEHLSPLYGLVRKNVGRKWDKVYSELKKNFDARSATGNHIFQHLYDQLANPAETFIGDDGKVWIGPHRYSGAQALRDSYYEFYVDPRDGILKRNLKRKTYRQVYRQRQLEAEREAAKTKRVVDKTTELHFINGVWFEIKFQVFEGTRRQVKVESQFRKQAYYRTETEYPFMFDVLDKRIVQKARVAISKRTINHRDLKRYGLVM